MVMIKVAIKKLKVFNEKFTRYYTVDNVLLDTYADIRTEAQFCYYIFRRFGTGRYLCIAWTKGQEGFVKFWNGDILENGFYRDRDKNKDLEKLQKELIKADSYEERELVEEDIEFERDISKEIKKTKRPQCFGLIKSKAGQINEYQEF